MTVKAVKNLALYIWGPQAPDTRRLWLHYCWTFDSLFAVWHHKTA